MAKFMFCMKGSLPAALSHTQQAVDNCEKKWRLLKQESTSWGWLPLLGSTGNQTSQMHTLAAATELAHSLNTHGTVLEALGRNDEAQTAWKQAIDLLNSGNVEGALGDAGGQRQHNRQVSGGF